MKTIIITLLLLTSVICVGQKKYTHLVHFSNSHKVCEYKYGKEIIRSAKESVVRVYHYRRVPELVDIHINGDTSSYLVIDIKPLNLEGLKMIITDKNARVYELVLGPKVSLRPKCLVDGDIIRYL